jgi:hypothetical protein
LSPVRPLSIKPLSSCADGVVLMAGLYWGRSYFSVIRSSVLPAQLGSAGKIARPQHGHARGVAGFEPMNIDFIPLYVSSSARSSSS